ncbi:MAG: N-acetylglucosamine kinase [Chitinophagaceae bacterium]
MQSKSILIADSGSTKTDWCFIKDNKRKKLVTQGINPYFLQEKEIVTIFKSDLKIKEGTAIDEIHFYGAGISSVDQQKVIERALKTYFKAAKVYCHSDMLASARACCLHSKGIVSILGTGSNTCYYDGKKIAFKTSALGYVLGDEGGGTHLGKKVLQYYLHEIFDQNLIKAFEKQFPYSKEEILVNLYKKPFPNRFLAQFTQFVFDHRGHYMIENIAEDCLNEIFINHLLRYPSVDKRVLHFTGSVAYFLQDILENLCHQYELQLGTIIQKPIDGLIQYHTIKKVGS